MKTLILLIAISFSGSLYAEKTDSLSVKDQCKLNNDETEISCVNGKVYKLHNGPTDVTLRINPKFDLEDLPARRPASGL